MTNYIAIFNVIDLKISRWFGCKWTMAISFIAYMPFIIAQLYPRAFTLIPSGLAVGFGKLW